MNRRRAHLWDIVLGSPIFSNTLYSFLKQIFKGRDRGFSYIFFPLCYKTLLYVCTLEVIRQALARMLYKGFMHFIFHANSPMQLSVLRKNNCNSGSTARLAISVYCKVFPLPSTLSGNGNSSLLSALIILCNKRRWLCCACLHARIRELMFKVPETGDAECAAESAFCAVLKREFSLLSVGQKNL